MCDSVHEQIKITRKKQMPLAKNPRRDSRVHSNQRSPLMHMGASFYNSIRGAGNCATCFCVYVQLWNCQASVWRRYGIPPNLYCIRRPAGRPMNRHMPHRPRTSLAISTRRSPIPAVRKKKLGAMRWDIMRWDIMRWDIDIMRWDITRSR